MYCKKLSNMLHNKDSQLHNITQKDIQKLDYFLREKTTLKERDRINVSRFSIEMDVDIKKSLRLFMVGVDEDLFNLVMYVDCDSPYCDETYRIKDIHSEIECDCGKNITPSKKNVDVYFKLMENPTNCNLDDEDISAYDLILGKSTPSKIRPIKEEVVTIKLDMLEEVVGKEKVENAINKSNIMDERLLKLINK